MGKAILVLDEMPDGCVGCTLYRKENRKGYNDYICAPKNQLVRMALGADRPDWCPLREMPARQKIYANSSDYAHEYACGWNDALRAIDDVEKITGTEKLIADLKNHRQAFAEGVMKIEHRDITAMSTVDVFDRVIEYIEKGYLDEETDKES